MEAEVRPPEPDELDAVVDMWVELAADQREHGSHLLAGANRAAIGETFARQLVVGGLRVAVADGPVGFVSFAPDTGRYEEDHTRGVVRNLYVRPAFRDRGIGSRLLAAAESALAADGADAVRIEAMADNEAARAFYERRGYDPHRVAFEKRVESDTRRD
ncbi:MAG: GNAT family N-acetyltransferase [Haloferacaceae archaeon]